MRGDQLARQWRLLRRIESGPRGYTAAELAELEGIGLRTAYRDLEALQEAGFPLYTEKMDRAQRWTFVQDFKFKTPQPFTLTELMSLHLYGDLARYFQGTPFHDPLVSLFKKVESTLPPQTKAYLDRIRSGFKVGLKPYKEYGRFREILHQLYRAVLDRQRVEMAYQPLKAKAETVRKVDPYRVWLLDGTIYLIGFCHLRGDIRTFVVDRIKMLHLTQESFEFPDDFDFEAFTRHSFKVMQDRVHRVKVRVSAGWARYVGEKVWHQSQEAEKLPDGSLLLTFEVAGLEEIRQWVLSLSPEVEVLEPRELKDLVREAHLKALEGYERTDPRQVKEA